MECCGDKMTDISYPGKDNDGVYSQPYFVCHHCLRHESGARVHVKGTGERGRKPAHVKEVGHKRGPDGEGVAK